MVAMFALTSAEQGLGAAAADSAVQGSTPRQSSRLDIRLRWQWDPDGNWLPLGQQHERWRQHPVSDGRFVYFVGVGWSGGKPARAALISAAQKQYKRVRGHATT
jgi:hypothetical protein